MFPIQLIFVPGLELQVGYIPGTKSDLPGSLLLTSGILNNLESSMMTKVINHTIMLHFFDFAQFTIYKKTRVITPRLQPRYIPSLMILKKLYSVSGCCDYLSWTTTQCVWVQEIWLLYQFYFGLHSQLTCKLILLLTVIHQCLRSCSLISRWLKYNSS